MADSHAMLQAQLDNKFPPTWRGEAMGWLTSATTLASIIGPYTMSLLSTMTPNSSLWPFLFTSAVSFLCMALYLVLDTSTADRGPNTAAVPA